MGRRTSGLAGEMDGGGAWPPSEGKKKWSIGKLFRRKKKDSDSEASSASTDEHSQKNNAKRKKSDKKKRSSVSRTNFDHTDLCDKRSQSVTKFPKKEYFDEGVLSDPSAGFVGYVGRGLPRSPLDQSRHRSKDSLYKLATASSCGSQDGSLRKGRKGRIKARVEAMRNSKNDSSSDDESQKSTSSSVFKFRSDDSLANHSKDGSVSKRSRSARNDRLIKRLSRDDESQLNREADLIQRGFSRSEAELLALKQRVLSTPQINVNNDKKYEEPDYSEPMKVLQSMPYDTKKSYSGSHLAGHTNLANSQGKDVVTRRHYPALSASNSSVYSYPAGIINFNAQVNDESITYSVPYNVNKQNRTDIPHSNQSFRRSASVEQNNYDSENVMVIKLPLGSVPKKEPAAPPPPPPRDPQRKVPTPVSYMYDNTRPMSYAFDSGARRFSQNYANNESFGISSKPQNIYENAAPIDKNTGLSWGKRPISTSEDHIAMQQQQYYNASTPLQNNQPKRPSSVSAEVIRPEVYNRYLARPQINNSHGHVKRDPARRHTQENANPEFMYYADMTPRSRRPIQIAPTDPVGEKNILTPTEPKPQAKNASDFWRKMDSQEIQRRKVFGHNRTLSDQSVSGLNTQQNLPLNVRNSSITSNVAMRPNIVNGSRGVISNKAQENYFKNNGLLGNRNNGQKDKTIRIGNKENEAICYSNIDIIPMDDIRHKKLTGKYSEDELSGSRRKSSNLEDALSELEAIYNSLGLGDEDLLDRADRQEMLAPKTAESLPYSSKDNFFRFPSLDDSNNEMNRRGSLSTKLSVIPDKVHDDMAYRRMNPNERPKSKDASKLTSQVSYMLASPVLADGQGSKIILDGESSEPDVVLDDVVFRNIRQANNYLKIEDPQPPFGIPLGPITPAPNSDYLHAVPDSKRRSRFIPQESPDIVSDDLAYRSLRKDSKNPSPVNKENPTCIFNNTSDNTNLSRPSKIFDNHVIKKKRAVRSLSANIFTLVQREIDDALDLCKNPSMEKAQSIPDLPEAVLEFGKSGKLPDNFKSSQQLLNVTKLEIKPKDNTVPEYKTTDMPKSNLRSVNGNDRVSKPEEFSKNYSINYLNSAASRLSNSNQIRNELDTMAQEAKETSAKLVIALEELQNEKLSRVLPENKENNVIKPVSKKDDKQNDITSSSSALQKYLYPSSEINIQPSKVNETKASISRQLSQSPTMKVKGTIPAHIKEKMEEFSRSNKNEDPSNDFMATINKLKSFGEQKTEPRPVLNTGKNTEDSLIAISNQLKIVGCQLKNNPEKPNMFQEESMRLKYLANKCEIDLNENCLPQTHNKLADPTVHSSAKYSFLNSDGNSFPKPTCISPKIVSSQSKIDTINNLQSFDELRKGISELLDGIGQVNEKLQFPKPTPQHQQNVEIKTVVVHHSKESSLDESSLEDTSKSRENRASPEYNSSEELAMIFNIPDEQKQPSTSKANNAEGKTESHLELNSPRLVKTANQNLRKLSLDELDIKVTELSKPQVIEPTRPQALEAARPQALEHTRPLALEPVSSQALEPIRPQAKEPAKSQTMDQSAEVSTSQEVPWRRNRRLSSTDNANKGKT